MPMSPYSVPVFDRLAWIDVVLLGWFALTFVSVALMTSDWRLFPLLSFTHAKQPSR
jgi:hypothetical protein